MNIRNIVITVIIVALLAIVIGWGRFEIRLLVSDEFRGVIRIDERSNGGELGFLFPSLTINPAGIAHLKSVDRFFGLRRVVAQWKVSGQRIPTRFGDEATKGAVCIWDLPASVNPEASFFIGTAKEHTDLIENKAFLQDDKPRGPNPQGSGR
jgi:hypothetical protein